MCVIQQKVNSLLSLRPLSLDCLMSTSAHDQVFFKLIYLLLTNSQLAIIHHILIFAMDLAASCDMCR